MPVTDTTVAKFWAHFASNAAALKAVPPEGLTTSKLFHRLSDQLEKCHKQLKPEIDTESVDGDWTVVITADGEERIFKFVETIVAAAPPVPGWKVRAFRSRSDVGGSRIVSGPHEVSGNDIFASGASAGAGRVAVTLYVRGLTNGNGLGRAAELLYQHAVGEYDAVKVASDLRLRPLPDPLPAGAVPLAELPGVIDRAVGRA